MGGQAHPRSAGRKAQNRPSPPFRNALESARQWHLKEKITKRCEKEAAWAEQRAQELAGPMAGQAPLETTPNSLANNREAREREGKVNRAW